MTLVRSAVLILLATAPSWAATLRSAAEGKALPPGVWGGPHAVLDVRAEGADVEMDCARGHVDEPLVRDGAGDFDLPGTLSPESHGPARDDAAPERVVRYRGHVEGDTMRLAIVGTGERDKGTTLAEFTLTRDRRPALTKCR